MINTHSCGKPVSLRIAYIGGGSRGWAHALMKDLLQYEAFTGEVRLYDINREMAELNATFGNWLQNHPEAASEWTYRVTASLKETLVLSTIDLQRANGACAMRSINDKTILQEWMKQGLNLVTTSSEKGDQNEDH